MTDPEYIIVEMKYQTIKNKLLRHYLKDTDFEYEFLTKEEKEIVGGEQVFNELMSRVIKEKE